MPHLLPSRHKRIGSGPAEPGAGLEPRGHSSEPDLRLWAPLAGETECFSIHTICHDFVQGMHLNFIVTDLIFYPLLNDIF